MPLQKTGKYFAVLAAAALTAGGAAAATQYTTLASWAAALTNGANTEASAFDTQNLSNTTLVVNGYGTFTGSGTATTMNVNNHPLVDLRDTTETVTAPAAGTNALLLWLGANQIGSGQFSAQALTITLTDSSNNTQTFNLTTAASSPSFWGFTSGTTINTINISAPSGYNVDLMDFFAGTFPPDPPPATASECATIIMLGTGLTGIGLRCKFANAVAA